MKSNRYIFLTFLLVSLSSHSQDFNQDELDSEFLNSLPDSIKNDVLSEMSAAKEEVMEENYRPSTKLRKSQTLRDFQNIWMKNQKKMRILN